MMLKDAILDDIVQKGGNVAQFVSYNPHGKKRFSRIRNVDPTCRFASVEEAVQAILDTGASFVNIRTFRPEKPDGNPFFFGRKGMETPVKVAAVVRKQIRDGLHVIVNEDIDINDGGFSGVMLGEIAEFAPCDTPRCVEKTGCAIMPRFVMANLIREVYERRISIPFDRGHRVEFSVHPGPVGYLRQYQIIWQTENTHRVAVPKESKPHWPNRYSEVMGDKAYGLLMAHLYGFLVPYTHVTGRIIPSFNFGDRTGSEERPWVRTCPRVQQPGLFTSKHGWLDPYALMQREDPDGSQITAIMEQDCVDASYSGAAFTEADGQLVIEGTCGKGDLFMVGKVGTIDLPDKVLDAITEMWEHVIPIFGPVRFEWVYDKTNTLWLVQFHSGQVESIGSVIYPGDASRWVSFDSSDGLDKMRVLVRMVSERRNKGYEDGIILYGDVGITSHFGDILRRNRIPARLERG